MEKISLKSLSLRMDGQLSRDEMKVILGGNEELPVIDDDSAADVCENKQGGCDFGDNCKRTSGAAGKCGKGPDGTGSCTCR